MNSHVGTAKNKGETSKNEKETRPRSSRLELADCLEHGHIILNLILLYFCDLNSPFTISVMMLAAYMNVLCERWFRSPR